MTQSSNPLKKYFRQPAIYLRLPSQGRGYAVGSLNMPANGEIPILPMTAVDEITSRTPDALFNGSSVANIIGSCVPNILDPWAVPSTDINALLTAIRLASYGHDMAIGTECPECKNSDDYTVDLRLVLDSLRTPDFDQALQQGDMTIFFGPLTYRQMNDNSRIKFDDQKIMQSIDNLEVPDEERMNRLGETFRKITDLTISTIAQSITAIKTTDAMATEQSHIEEFVRNCPKSMYEAIKNQALKLRQTSDIKPLTITCAACQHVYEQIFTLDMSNFFEAAS